LGGFSPEKAGWSAAPEVGQGLARQKEQCDEMVAQIRSGTFQQYYLYSFGKIERVWDYVCAVAKRSRKEKDMEENLKVKEELIGAINTLNSLLNEPEDLDILEAQRQRRISETDGRIIDLFVKFYKNALDLGVEVGLFSYQKGGTWYPSKEERGMGVPLMPHD
jgi:hypothetical protein